MIKKLKYILFLLSLTSSQVLWAQQNFIYNYDFEYYYLCPNDRGQTSRCIGFFSLIEDPDYSNCNYDITQYYPFYTADSGAYSGNAFMTVATYGNAIGGAESIGQNLLIPLDSGITYDFFAVVKKADSSTFSQSCGGLNLYGFADTIYGPNWSICTASLPGATLLGNTDTVNNILWSLKSFTFTTPFKIKAIALSPACAVNCFQVIFLDSIGISANTTNIENELTSDAIYINEIADEKIEIYFNENAHERSLFLYDIKGKLKYEGKAIEKFFTINTKNITNGIYLLKVNSGMDQLVKKIIVRH